MVGHLSSAIVTDSFITIYFVTVSHAVINVILISFITIYFVTVSHTVINVIFITFFPLSRGRFVLCFSDPVAPVNKYPDMYISDYVIFFYQYYMSHNIHYFAHDIFNLTATTV